MKNKNTEPFLPGLEGMSPKQRREYLKDNAYKIEQGKFFKNYNDDELSAKKDEFTEGAIKLGDKEDEFSEVKADFNGKIKTMKMEQKSMLNSIRSKGEYRDGDTYMFDDQENGVMYVFDEEGNEIEKRKLRPDEKQKSVLSVARDAKAK